MMRKRYVKLFGAIMLMCIMAVFVLTACSSDKVGADFNSVLSNGNRIIAEKGVVLQAWLPSSESEDVCLSQEDLIELGFGPSYYDGNMFNESLHTGNDTQWSLAKAPNGTNGMDKSPNGNEWLSPAQLQYKDKLISVCFGDEQEYSDAEVEYLRKWFDDFRSRNNNVLLHSNQWSGQWKQKEYTNYVKVAQPDMLTFDTYYYQESKKYATKDYKIPATIAEAINNVRLPAMAGHDGSGKSPIPFGQYLLGYKTGENPMVVGNYEITESQKNLVPSLTLTMGGKWLDIFRIIKNEQFLFYDKDGNKTEHFNQYATIAKEINNASAHLSKLQTTGVEVVPGKHKFAGLGYTNSLPNKINKFSKKNDFAIDSIKVKNLGSENDGYNGDVFVGYFDTLPGMNFDGKDRQYFAVCNALSSGNTLPKASQNGSSDATKQEISLKMRANSAKKLYSVNLASGAVKEENINNVNFELGGGKMRIFYWE